ncbi:hypothetical protein ASE35_03250 [Lysobacter sp. Root916]|uniref:BrnT family toxin n=1 Tax=Lysobacter sp. Root916 TaxID=1736606 RepID=UPI00070E76BE|nr:BrnT family toxin [Lysobacter sp. Root916]KRD39389.1 hypothetical protein ASE35_03250 [Lysobacter sp. Root916]
MVEFDPQKAAANLKKHGIALADAEPVIYDERALTLEDHADDEVRSVTVGRDALRRILVVVWVERGDRVRIISARPATAKERQAYES